VNFRLDNRIDHANVKEARHAHYWLDLIPRPPQARATTALKGDTPCAPPDGPEVADLRIEAPAGAANSACAKCAGHVVTIAVAAFVEFCLAPAGRAVRQRGGCYPSAYVSRRRSWRYLRHDGTAHSRYSRPSFTQPSADSVAYTRPGQTAGFTGSTSATQTRPKPTFFDISESLPSSRGHSRRPTSFRLSMSRIEMRLPARIAYLWEFQAAGTRLCPGEPGR
jgi:hypothetical protein